MSSASETLVQLASTKFLFIVVIESRYNWLFSTPTDERTSTYSALLGFYKEEEAKQVRKTVDNMPLEHCRLSALSANGSFLVFFCNCAYRVIQNLQQTIKLWQVPLGKPCQYLLS